jgi:hypothetical protein
VERGQLGRGRRLGVRGQRAVDDRGLDLLGDLLEQGTAVVN